jgi:beta-galactosidase
VLFGPRSGSKTRYFAIPENLPPGPLASLIPIRVIEVASLRPGLRDEVRGLAAGAAERWRERIELIGAAQVDARFEDGDPALVRAGRWSYLACWPDATLLAGVIRKMAARAGLAIETLPEGVRLRRRGNLTFAFNYGDEVFRAPSGSPFLLGGPEVGPSEVAIWRS